MGQPTEVSPVRPRRMFFTSDEHYGHRNIIEYSGRPFRDIGEMESELIRRHNAVVTNDDVVWHLGDFALDEGYVPYILPQLRGEHRLIPGNHDACWPGRSKAAKFVRKYLEWGFTMIHPSTESLPMILTGLGMVDCHHMPYVGDHTDRERYADVRPTDTGRLLLHGHVHEKWKRRGRMINVGVDQWDYAPVSLERLVALTQETE